MNENIRKLQELTIFQCRVCEGDAKLQSVPTGFMDSANYIICSSCGVMYAHANGLIIKNEATLKKEIDYMGDDLKKEIEDHKKRNEFFSSIFTGAK